MSPQALIALLFVLIVLTLSATPLVRDFTTRQVRRVRQRVLTRRSQRVSTGTTVITGSGDEVEVLEELPPPPRRAARFSGHKRRVVAALVAAFSARELAALERAAKSAPGPLSALAAAIPPFAARAFATRGWRSR